jgi:hypothetical protein
MTKRIYKKCLDCNTTNKKISCTLCDNCRKLRRIKRLELANKKKHKCIGKEKSCKECSNIFLTKGPASLYCDICAPIILKSKIKLSRDKTNISKGIKIGIGSGNFFGKYNKNHPSYKNGITWYRDLILNTGLNTCQRCMEVIDFSNSHKWCVHHIDHNRANNNVNNLELLCKKCHQLEHNCIDNLPNK